MRVHLRALGCRLNEAELQSWRQEFEAQGHTLTDHNPDLMILNTCAVTSEAVRKSRQLSRRLLQQNPQAKLVLTGCYSSLEPEQAKALGADLVVTNPHKQQLVARCSQLLPKHTATGDTAKPAVCPPRHRQRAFVKIQDGCRYRCSFCIVTLARGVERSRPVDEIVSQINTLHRNGANEVVLTGVHAGGYGSDINSTLSELLREILHTTQIPRIRLGSVEPWDLPADFFTLFGNSRLQPHLHLPMQSGADSVLRRMARRCRVGEFARLAQQARNCADDFNLTTDIIVGFPGETEAEFLQTLEFVQRMQFADLHIFRYSPRTGTKAATLAEPIPADIKRLRYDRLSKISRQLRYELLQAQIGRELPVLWESMRSHGHQQCISGYTPNYLRVVSTGEKAIAGQISLARIRALSDNGQYLLAD